MLNPIFTCDYKNQVEELVYIIPLSDYLWFINQVWTLVHFAQMTFDIQIRKKHRYKLPMLS